MKIITNIRKKIGQYPSKRYIKTLVAGGAKIGKKVIIYSPHTVFLDNTRPWLLEIGDYTKICRGCLVLTHDYSLSVLRRVYGEWIGEGAITSIGENCFIGMNSIILMGSNIGNNVIVGAGSVVRGTIPDNVVVAGNPAKIVCSLDEHYKRRLERTKEEAEKCAQAYYKKMKKKPSPKDMENFKFLFMPRNANLVEKYGLSFLCNGDEASEVEKYFYLSVPYWNSFEAFLRDAGL